LRRDDEAISPIIATILLVAVTVILGSTIYAAVAGFGSKTPKATVDAAFKTTGIDVSGNGLTDHIKLTYLSGPTGISPAVSVKNQTAASAAAVIACPATMKPGDFCTWTKAGPGAKGSYSIVVTIGNTVVYDGSVDLEE
jgi:flagellin-like protein